MRTLFSFLLASLPASAQETPVPPSYSPVGPIPQVFAVRNAEHTQQALIERLRDAEHNYPLAYAREQLTEIMKGFDNGTVVLTQVSALDPEYAPLEARRDLTPDGRFVIQYVWENNLRMEQTIQAKFPDDPLQVGQSLTDYYVMLTLYAWSHHVLGHELPNDATPSETIRAQESEVLLTIMGLLITGAWEVGRFRYGFGETNLYGIKCYHAAGGRSDHPAWQAFMDWYMDNNGALAFCGVE